MNVIDSIDITVSMFTSSVSESSTYSNTTYYHVGDEVVRATTQRRYIALVGNTQSVTFQLIIGSPNAVTSASGGLTVNTPLKFITTGTLPSGLSTGTTYYVVFLYGDGVSFDISDSPGGSAIAYNGGGTGYGIHKAIIVENINKIPEDNPTYWRDAGATNLSAPFDKKLSTKVAATTSLYYEITPGAKVSAIAVHAMSGVTGVRVQQFEGATSRYDSGTVDVTGDSSVAFWNLYSTAAVKTKITFTGGTMSVGAIDIGMGYDVGALVYGAELPRKDYSIKQFDDFGEEVIVRRPFSRQLNGTVTYLNTSAQSIGRIWDSLRAKICTWQGVLNNDALSEPFTIYGFWRTFSPRFDNPTKVNASIAIEGAAET